MASDLEVGSLVYLISERSKLQPRDKYMITELSYPNGTCTVRKFINDQFRSKSYKVPLTDVFHIVKPAVKPVNAESSDSESNFQEESPELSENSDYVESSTSDQEEDSPPACRPQRKTSTPAWHNDYVMGTALDKI